MQTRTGFMLAAALALVALGAGPATAQEPSQRIVSIGLGGGVVVPVSDAKSAFDNGFNGHGFIKFNLPMLPIQPRVDFLFQKLDINDVTVVSPEFTPGSYTGGDQQILGGLAHLQFNLIKAGPIQPYLVAGVGLSSMKTTLDETGGGSTSQSTTKLTVDGGGGILARLGPVSAFVEGRINNVVNDGRVIDFKSVQTVPVSFGIVF
jgi:hypothetical protein